MIDEDLVRPLLESLSGDDDPTHQRLLLEALVALDPTSAASQAAAVTIAPSAVAMAEDLLDAETAALLVRVPLRSVREKLQRIAADGDHPNALAVAIALADVRDDAGLATLLQALARSPNEEVARALAALPLESAAVSAADLAPVVRMDDSGNDETRLWSAIALARVGDYEPFEQLWDALARPPHFWERSQRPALLRELPSLFHGDPSVTIARLASVRPLPERFVRFILALRDNDYDADWNPRNPEIVGDARNPTLLVAGLTGTCDQYGEPVAVTRLPAAAAAPPSAGIDARAIEIAQRLAVEPWRGPHPAIDEGEFPLLANIPPDLSAQVIEHGVEELAAQAAAFQEGQRFLLGNALLELAGALPARLPLRIADVLQKRAIRELPRHALAWTLARAGASNAVHALTPYIAASEGDERTEWLNWLVDIAAQIDAPAPFSGAGGEQAAPRKTAEVIDDTPARAAGAPTPVGRAAPLREVYPDISADDAHPIAGKTVSFTVTLTDAPAASTTGRVRMPDSPPEVEHTLRVHLLFGTVAAWDTLTWSAARGTIKAAMFSLPAPAIAAERALTEARANFYLNQRWCGAGQRNLDVRRDANVAPQTDIPLPGVPPWCRGLVLEPDALPSDLIVRVQRGAAAGDFVWSCLSPHLDFPAPANEGDDRMSLKEDAATFVRRTFAPLANKPLERLKLAEVEGAGEKIYRCTPPYFRDCYWALWRAAAAGGFAFESVQIVTDEPCVPWELMRLRDAQRAPGVAPELLAIRHCVGRWLAGESASMRQRILIRDIAVSASSYGDIAAVTAKLPWAASEQELMVDEYRASAIPLRSEALLDFLESGAAQAVHLACHGKMSITDPDSSVLVMEDTPNDVTPLLVARSEVCDGLGSHHPLVFLNACEVGAAAASLSLIAGFPAAFLYAGASALVSPLWAVNDERAHEFAEAFYREVFVADGRKPLGAVLRDLRVRWKAEKHLTYLAYVLYGDPMARVEYRPE